MQPAYDTIIIGAGMSGLAAGIRLAMFGQRVCIVERHTKVGGLNSFYRRGGRDYDVGLHALTNYAPPGARRGPLPLLLRQLRLDGRDLDLAPQIGSTIAFPGVSLDFGNEFGLLESEVGRQFPGQKDAFQRLVGQILDYDQLGSAAGARSAREVAGSLIREPLLLEMLFCPLLYFGGSRENDLDFGQFSVLFRSIYLEGLARPRHGVRRLLDSLVRKFEQLGGELRLGRAVRRIVSRDSAAHSLLCGDGAELTAQRFLSSAGWPETRQLLEDQEPFAAEPAGQLSFLETILVLDAPPRDLGCRRTIVFYNDAPVFRYQKPDDLVDEHSGVITSPNNFQYDEPLEEGWPTGTAGPRWSRRPTSRPSSRAASASSRRPSVSCPTSGTRWWPATPSRR